MRAYTRVNGRNFSKVCVATWTCVWIFLFFNIDGETDSSGVAITLTTTEQHYLAGVYLFETSSFKIPPKARGNIFYLVTKTLEKSTTNKVRSSENHLHGIIHLVRTQNFPKTNVSCPLINTSTYAYQGFRNVSFSENFAYVLNEWLLLNCFRFFVLLILPDVLVNAEMYNSYVSFF